MAELSIIVPIYNVEKYLERCIDSILAQTYKDFELILINDGSPDRCAEIMEQYADKDSRIVTIHQKNKGVSAARNAGLRLAQGKYVGFVDPDDWIERKFFEELIWFLEEKELDIVCCNWFVVEESGSQRSYRVNEIPKQMLKKEFVNHLFDSPRTIGGSNCNKLFIRDKVCSFYDETMKICEDNMFLLKYCKNIKKAGYIPMPLYYVFERSDSATRGDLKKQINVLDARERLIYAANRISREARMYAEKDFLDCCYWYLKNFESKKDEKDYFLKVFSVFQRYIKNNLFKVIFNSKIFWKTKLLYFKTIL